MNVEITQSLLNYFNVNRQKNEELFVKASSGKRINRAADDAAGLSIATRMKKDSSGMDMARRNAQDGSSMMETADAAANSAQNILQRMRDLAVQADNGTLNADDKAALQGESDQLAKELDHIAQTSNFNGVKLFDGTQASAQLHVSEGATDTVSANLGNGTNSALGTNALNLSADPQGAIAAIDGAMDKLSASRSDFGAMQNRLSVIDQNLSDRYAQNEASRSRIEDADMAKTISDIAKGQIQQHAQLSALQQSNQQSATYLKFLM